MFFVWNTKNDLQIYVFQWNNGLFCRIKGKENPLMALQEVMEVINRQVVIRIEGVRSHFEGGNSFGFAKAVDVFGRVPSQGLRVGLYATIFFETKKDFRCNPSRNSRLGWGISLTPCWSTGLLIFFPYGKFFLGWIFYLLDSVNLLCSSSHFFISSASCFFHFW